MPLDRRVLDDEAVAIVQACQARVTCHLAGGAALSAAYLHHRLSGDIDLFCHAADDVRALVRSLDDVAKQVGASIRVVRDAGHVVRAVASGLTIDIVYESLPDLEAPPPPIDGVVVESLIDLRASKLTFILSRSEPRDLVDLLFLDRAGHPPERDLGIALQKDAGIDPAILAWLLSQFPIEPLPKMIEPLTPEELRRFRDELALRMGAAATK
jgi:hypothetical protein